MIVLALAFSFLANAASFNFSDGTRLSTMPAADCRAILGILEVWNLPGHMLPCGLDSPSKSISTEASYALKRLWTLYRARQVPLAQFCTDNERELERDIQLLGSLGDLNLGSIFQAHLGEAAMGGANPFPGEMDGWELIARHGLTEGELTTLHNYFGAGFWAVNRRLQRGEVLSEPAKAYLREFDSALARMPEYHGVVTRYSDLWPAQLDEHQVGATVPYNFYVSTSKLPDWKFQGRNKFVIHVNKNCHDVSDANPAEGEVLCLPGTKFKIRSRVPREGGGFDFEMDEVD